MHPVGYLLTSIGLILVVFATGFILISLRKQKVTLVLHNDEKIRFDPKREGLTRVSYLIRLRNKSEIVVILKPTAGPFDFFIGDYFSPGMDPNQGWVFNPFLEVKCLPKGESYNFDLDLEPGDYQFSFHSTGPKSEALLNTTATYIKKPFERLLGVGLQLLEVGLPVLITGIVLFFGL